MPGLTTLLARLIRDRKGATVIEYGFIIALVILAMMVALVALGGSTSSMWDGVSTKVLKVTPASAS